MCRIEQGLVRIEIENSISDRHRVNEDRLEKWELIAGVWKNGLDTSERKYGCNEMQQHERNKEFKKSQRKKIAMKCNNK